MTNQVKLFLFALIWVGTSGWGCTATSQGEGSRRQSKTPSSYTAQERDRLLELVAEFRAAGHHLLGGKQAFFEPELDLVFLERFGRPYLAGKIETVPIEEDPSACLGEVRKNTKIFEYSPLFRGFAHQNRRQVQAMRQRLAAMLFGIHEYVEEPPATTVLRESLLNEWFSTHGTGSTDLFRQSFFTQVEATWKERLGTVRTGIRRDDLYAVMRTLFWGVRDRKASTPEEAQMFRRRWNRVARGTEVFVQAAANTSPRDAPEVAEINTMLTEHASVPGLAVDAPQLAELRSLVKKTLPELADQLDGLLIHPFDNFNLRWRETNLQRGVSLIVEEHGDFPHDVAAVQLLRERVKWLVNNKVDAQGNPGSLATRLEAVAHRLAMNAHNAYDGPTQARAGSLSMPMTNFDHYEQTHSVWAWFDENIWGSAATLHRFMERNAEHAGKLEDWSPKRFGLVEALTRLLYKQKGFRK